MDVVAGGIVVRNMARHGPIASARFHSPPLAIDNGIHTVNLGTSHPQAPYHIFKVYKDEEAGRIKYI